MCGNCKKFALLMLFMQTRRANVSPFLEKIQNGILNLATSLPYNFEGI